MTGKFNFVWLFYAPYGGDLSPISLDRRRRQPSSSRILSSLLFSRGNENMSDEDFVFADLGKQISPLIITFIPDEHFFYTALVVGVP